jgi:cysteine-rich repeat protein
MKRFLAIAGLVVLTGTNAWAVVVDNPDDICAANADPCLVALDYDIVDGTVLDFGTRAVQLTADGVLDTNTGTASILCGNFSTAAGTIAALKVRGGNGLGGIDGGTLTVEARRRCSGDSNRTCVSANGCNFGTCTLSVCSEDTNVTCETDDNCDYGTCNLGVSPHKCTGNTNRTCVGDEDCNLGTCTIDVCSTNRNEQCTANADCDFGECTVGNANVQILRPINGNGGTPGTLFIRAAGDITIGGIVTFDSGSSDSDGGILDIESGFGSVTINSQMTATGGGFATGGEVCLIAGQDVTVNAIIDASGGDFDGGFIEFDAGRDVIVKQAVKANAVNGGGFGGEIAITAVGNVSATAPASFETNGHFASAGNFGGDGGAIELDAGVDVNVGANVDVISDGAEPDGFGGEVILTAGGTMQAAGTMEARSGDAAGQGSGGNVELDVEGSLNFPVGALIDVRGASNGGGAASITTNNGPMTFAGNIDARTVAGGIGDQIDLDIGGDVTMTGQMRISGVAQGDANGSIDFEFCRLTMNSGALIENVGAKGKNTLRQRERLTIRSGASMKADITSGVNKILYRDPAKPPSIAGTVTPPAAANDISPLLVGCPVCGNGDLDGGESCEDGNTEDGDGCSADCQDEACVAQTPGYPDVPLCDDGDGCTTDTCASSTCEHVESCDDGIDCTADSCSAQNECVHVPQDSSCSDDNDCTTDVCSLGARDCVHVNNSANCDDGLACTDTDHCTNGLCAGTNTCPDEQICNPSTGQCQTGGCGDGFVDGDDQCDDGDIIWNPGEGCDSTCQLLLCGDPDDSGQLRASDALFILRVAVHTSTCDDCVCNVDNSTTGAAVSASDALRVLRKSVGADVEILCPVCV